MKIRVWVSTNKVGSKCENVIEIDDADWAEMSDEDKEELASETKNDMMEWNWEECPKNT